MRNVASKHQVHQTENIEAPPLEAERELKLGGDEGRVVGNKTWSSLPALELNEKQGFKEEENADENGEEELQEVR